MPLPAALLALGPAALALGIQGDSHFSSALLGKWAGKQVGDPMYHSLFPYTLS